LLEPGSFDVYKNAAAPMIAMLDYSGLDIKVSDADMETMETDDYREMLRNDGDANGVLAVTQEGAKFSYKDR